MYNTKNNAPQLLIRINDVLPFPAEALPSLRVAVGPEGAVLVAVASRAPAREGVPPETGQAAVALPSGGVAQALLQKAPHSNFMRFMLNKIPKWESIPINL